MWIMLSEWDVDFVYVARIKLHFYHAHDQLHHRCCNNKTETIYTFCTYIYRYLCMYGTRHINLRGGFSNYAQLKHKSILWKRARRAELVVSYAYGDAQSPNAVLERRCALHFYTLSIYICSLKLRLSQSSRIYTFCLYIAKNNV